MKLRPYQQDAADNAIMDITSGLKKVCSVLSTGSGKTIIFIDIAYRYKALYGKKVLVLSDSSILTEQNATRFRQFHPELKTGILQADQIPDRDCDVVIATVQSSKIETKIMSWLGDNKDEIGLVIIDECHCLDTKSYDKALSYFKHAIQYGTTASPYRSRQLMTNYFDKISYTISMQELIEMKYLVPPNLKQILKKEDKLAQCVELYMRNELGCKAGIFLKTQEEAKLLRNLFQQNNVNAEVILGNTNRKTRTKIIEGFNNGDIDILCTCNVISKGFDSHKLEVIMMPYGTNSPTLFLQRIGRGSRPEDGDSVKSEHSKQDCRVYMFGDAPSIKNGFYKKLEHFALNDGSDKDKLDVHEELETMEILDEDKSSSIYVWTSEICEVSKQLQKLGKVEIDKLIRYKQFPKRYLRNPALLKQGLTGNFDDTMEGFIRNVRQQIEKDSGQSWIISDGLNVGKDIRRMHNFHLLKLVRSKGTSPRTKQLIKSYWRLKRNIKKA